MATAVLRSHDCLKNRIHVDFFGSRPPPAMRSSRRKHSRSPPSSPPSSPPVRTRPAPRRPAGSPPPLPEARPSRKPDKENAPAGSSLLARPRSKALVMGEVTILKRGEEPKPFLPSKVVDAVLCSTNPLGPDPGAVPKFSALGCSTYAGPAFISSPAPSALPFPESFLKKEDLATKGLRCLLRLDGR